MMDFPKPTTWDLVAIAAAGVALALAAANTVLALGGEAGQGPSTTFTLVMIALHVLVSSGCLLVLGKTAKHGTIWGNLAAVAGMFIGVSGVLLAGAMWVAA